jgi:serine/threonine protein kinase
MSDQKKKIGEGSYGCVYRPALKCANGIQIPDENLKVAKILKKDSGETEFNEYETISVVDPGNQYYVGKPEKCVPDELDFRANVEKSGCRIIDTKNPQDYLLLFYKDGGSDLSQFVAKDLANFLLPGAQKQSDLFWLNAHSLFKGLKLFAENDIMHDDLKPQNIVFKYDLEKGTMRFNYIDFGIMEKRSKMEENIKKSKMTRPFHWSRPLEQGFIKSASFPENYKNICKDHGKVDAEGKVVNFIESYSKFITHGISKKKKWEPFLLTFKYKKNVLLEAVTAKDVYDDVKLCMESLIHYKDNSNEFVKKTLKTCDSYSLGFSLNYVANKMHEKNALTVGEYLTLHDFFKKLFDFNLVNRMDDMEMILTEYESVLSQNGVLDRLGKKFANHIVTDAAKVVIAAVPVPELTAEQEQKIGMTDPGMNDVVLSKVSLKNVTKKVKSKDSKKNSAKDNK